MVALKKDTTSDVTPIETPVDPAVSAAETAGRLLDEGRRLVTAMQAATRFTSSIRPDGTCPIFFNDEVFHIALPWADFDLLQMQLLARHAPKDEVFLRQLFDLVPSLEGKAFVDVGAYTGSTAMIVRKFLNPRETHLFEPQKTMKTALDITVTVNDADEDVTLHTDVIDEEDQQILLGAYRPDRLYEVTYLRREGGPLRARAIDNLGIADIGYINLDYNNSKINALRGAAQTIEKDRPIITIDLAARDINEVKEFLAPHDYENMRAGQHSTIFLPR